MKHEHSFQINGLQFLISTLIAVTKKEKKSLCIINSLRIPPTASTKISGWNNELSLSLSLSLLIHFRHNPLSAHRTLGRRRRGEESEGPSLKTASSLTTQKREKLAGWKSPGKPLSLWTGAPCRRNEAVALRVLDNVGCGGEGKLGGKTRKRWWWWNMWAKCQVFSQLCWFVKLHLHQFCRF